MSPDYPQEAGWNAGDDFPVTLLRDLEAIKNLIRIHYSDRLSDDYQLVYISLYTFWKQTEPYIAGAAGSQKEARVNELDELFSFFSADISRFNDAKLSGREDPEGQARILSDMTNIFSKLNKGLYPTGLLSSLRQRLVFTGRNRSEEPIVPTI